MINVTIKQLSTAQQYRVCVCVPNSIQDEVQAWSPWFVGFKTQQGSSEAVVHSGAKMRFVATFDLGTASATAAVVIFGFLGFLIWVY